MKSLAPLLAAGCRAWIDDLTRRWLDDGTFGRFIDEDGISGVTSNPAIFERAIGSDVAYAAGVAAARAAGLTPQAAYESLVGEDLQRAADRLAAVHRDSAGRDGFVSWEVAPEHAYSAESTIDAAQRLWHRLERANGLIKIPATPAGVIAIRALVAQGIPVNVTLLFGLRRYAEVVGAVMAGLEDRLQRGWPLAAARIVTSVFLSRIDTAADRALAGASEEVRGALRGQAALAVAVQIYRMWCTSVESARWRRLAAAGAVPPGLLWASTASKDPAYPPLKYVDPVAWPGTINTLTPATLAAWRRRPTAFHAPGPADGAWADEIMTGFAAQGVSLPDLAETLEIEGVRLFRVAYDRTLAALERRLSAMHSSAGDLSK